MFKISSDTLIAVFPADFPWPWGHDKKERFACNTNRDSGMYEKSDADEDTDAKLASGSGDRPGMVED